MKQIAAKRQVLCITHLPQVAAPADAHYVVTKQAKDGRTISEIELPDKNPTPPNWGAGSVAKAKRRGSTPRRC